MTTQRLPFRTKYACHRISSTSSDFFPAIRQGGLFSRRPSFFVAGAALLLSLPALALAAISEDFSGPDLTGWSITYPNTSDAGWERNFDGGNLNTTGVDPTANVTWTTVRLEQSFDPLRDLSGTFVHSWDQPDGRELEMPLLQLRLWAGSENVIFGLRDVLIDGWGILRADAVEEPAPQSGTAVWEFERTGDQLTLRLNGDLFLQKMISSDALFDRAEILLQGRHMLHPDVGWDWTNTQTLELLEIEGKSALGDLDFFARWQHRHFSIEQLADAIIAGPMANPSGDGIPNLLKYALGGDPFQPDRSVLPVLGRESVTAAGDTEEFLTLSFSRPADISDLLYSVEAMADLSESSAPAGTFMDPAENEDGTISETWLDDVPVGETDRRFVQLEVELDFVDGIVSDDFSGPELDPAWEVFFANTDDFVWERNFDGGNLNTTGLTAFEVENWTTVRLMQEFEEIGNFRGRFVHSWEQDDGRTIERPLLQMRLWSGDPDDELEQHEWVIFGLRDAASTPPWGFLRAFGNAAGEVRQNVPQAGLAVWDFERTGAEFSLFLNGDLFFEAPLAGPVGIVEIIIQGNHMNHSSVGWDWTNTQSVWMLNIAESLE